uniref:F-actin monooxygenase n=1 Tax=Callorhinchus milii TaxID=7868 RepID=A0A4W3ICD1_CALMI
VKHLGTSSQHERRHINIMLLSDLALGWRADLKPSDSSVADFQFEVIIGADGRRNTLEGFRRKEFRGKLAIAITANFINRHTREEAAVEEISGVAFIFNQKFFQDLREATGIDLENIVYYRDDTHYFVMTAKKPSLLSKGVILQDYPDTDRLLSRNNVDQDALLNYAREAADFSTNQQLPRLDFAINHYGQPDVAMFDFTCMYASENASLIREESGQRLLVTLVGDSLLEPFWPMGTGIARGFLAAFDSAWMVQKWAQDTNPLSIVAERELIYRLLPQTTPQNINKNFNQYSIDPSTRYPKLNLQITSTDQVLSPRSGNSKLHSSHAANSTPIPSLSESMARAHKLLTWCQKQTQGYKNVNVVDLTSSWKSGLALSAIIHRYRPDLIEFDSLDEKDVEKNNQMAFDLAEHEFGISPIMTGKDMASVEEPDKLSMVMYLTQFYEMLKDVTPEGELCQHTAAACAPMCCLNLPAGSHVCSLTQGGCLWKVNWKESWCFITDVSFTSNSATAYCLAFFGLFSILLFSFPISNFLLPHCLLPFLLIFPSVSLLPFLFSFLSFSPSFLLSTLHLLFSPCSLGGVSSLAQQITSQLHRQDVPGPFQEKRILPSMRMPVSQYMGDSDVCYFCGKRVYVMERLSAEGVFFHRGCFKCNYCGTTLRLSSYAFNPNDGNFYCKPHYRQSSTRKRPAEATSRFRGNVNAGAHCTFGFLLAAAVEEPSQPKRLRGTPERIELENIRVSLEREEELEEVPEETLAEHNLSSGLGKGSQEPASSSSESEMEEQEEEEDEEEEEEEEGEELPPSDLGGVPWNEAVRRHQLLKGTAGVDTDPEAEEESESSEASSAPSVRNEAVRAWLESLSGGSLEPRSGSSQQATSAILAVLPIRSQPAPSIPDAASQNRQIQPQSLTGSEVASPGQSPVCSQPLSSPEASNPTSSQSPVRSQPVFTTLMSTPANDNTVRISLGECDHKLARRTFSDEEHVSKLDTIDEFWLKSMEIRKSLGVRPADRSGSSETSFTLSTPESTSPRSFTPEETPEEHKRPQPIIRTPTLTMAERQRLPGLTSTASETRSVISAPKDLTSTSGLGLNGSLTLTVTGTSDSFNNSDIMLTPPSSPPPPPPADEEPATLRRKKHYADWQAQTQPSPLSAPGTSSPSPAPPRPNDVRKSLAESIDEIPFADDVEDTYEDKTPDSSLQERFYTPPSGKPRADKLPDLPLSQASPSPGTILSRRSLPQISPEAKEVAEERMRAREKSVKSRALRDAMAKQLSKMKDMEVVSEARPRPNLPMSSTPRELELEAETLKPQVFWLKDSHRLLQETPVDRQPGRSQDQGSAASSDSSASKSKKRSSLFSPRKNKKEKKSKTDGTLPDRAGTSHEEATKPRSIWKSVFSGYKKDRKKKEEKGCSSSPSSSTTMDSGRKQTTDILRTALQLRRHLSFSEDSDLSSDDILERTSQKSKREKPYTEEELNAKLTRRVQKAARKQAKQEELKRLHRAQIIQRQLEQVEEKQRELEERGVAVEKALRGEAGMGKKDDPRLMQEWFKLVQEKNTLVRYESELMIFARELELEDRQSRLQQELRERMAIDDNLKSSAELGEEKRILNEMLEVVEQRDSLVALLEEQRLREKEEDKDLEAVMLTKSYNLNWS